MTSIPRYSNAEISTAILTFTTFACVASTFLQDLRQPKDIPLLVIGGTAVTVYTEAVARAFFKALDSQKASLIIDYLKSPYFTPTLVCLIIENENLFSAESVREVGLLILGMHVYKKAASMVSPFLTRPPQPAMREYTPPTTSIDYQKFFADTTLSGRDAVKAGNHYVLNDEEVQQALSDQGQRIRIASCAYKTLERHFPYNEFTLKVAHKMAKIADNIHWDTNLPNGYQFKSRSIQTCGLQAGICESMGSLEEYMEDRTLVTKIDVFGIFKIPVFAVFDGHGGSDEAAIHLETHLSTKLTEKFEFFLIESGSVEVTDTVIYNALKSTLIALDEGFTGAGGTTANIVIAWNKYLYTANIGDSRSIEINEKTGAVQMLSEDALPNDPRHKQIIEALGGSVTKAKKGAWRASSSHAMGSAFANPSSTKVMNPTVDIAKNPMTPGSLIVIASDGVWDSTPSFGLGKAFCYKYFRTSTQEIAEDIVHSSIVNHSSDNLSAVVVRISPD